MSKNKSANKREREDFVRVVPVKGAGSASYNSNALSVYCTPDEPAEVTIGEWESILKNAGAFELVKN